MDTEIHIAGIIVHTSPPHLAQVHARLSALPGTLVHAASDDGRLVVTLEAESAPATLDRMDAIRALPGVFTVALVYQHAEPASALDEELS